MGTSPLPPHDAAIAIDKSLNNAHRRTELVVKRVGIIASDIEPSSRVLGIRFIVAVGI